jgi:hypothetical protein
LLYFFEEFVIVGNKYANDKKLTFLNCLTMDVDAAEKDSGEIKSSSILTK